MLFSIEQLNFIESTLNVVLDRDLFQTEEPIVATATATITCTAVSKKGLPCKNKSKTAGLCGRHQPKAELSTEFVSDDSDNETVLCSGMSKKGAACKNKPKPDSEFCGRHRPRTDEPVPEVVVVMCTGVSKKGVACKSKAKKETRFCARHTPKETVVAEEPREEPVGETPVEIQDVVMEDAEEPGPSNATLANHVAKEAGHQRMPKVSLPVFNMDELFDEITEIAEEIQEDLDGADEVSDNDSDNDMVQEIDNIIDYDSDDMKSETSAFDEDYFSE